MRFETREFMADAMRLVADVAGDEAGAPALLLHGGGQTRASWRGALSALAERKFFAVAVDLRGHADSDRAIDGDYRTERFAADVRAIAGTFEQAPFLVGASLGGLAALLATAEEPRVATPGLVLVDIVPNAEPEGTSRVVAFMRSAPDGFATLEDAGAAVTTYLPHRPPPKNVDGLRRNLRLGEDGRWRWHWDPRFLDGRLAATPDRERLIAAARALTPPTLLVRGARSLVVSHAAAERFRSLVPQAEVVDVANADHMVAGDQNDAFVAAVIEFLERHRGTPWGVRRREPRSG